MTDADDSDAPRGPATFGRGDIAQHAETIMRNMREASAEAKANPLPTRAAGEVDTLYCAQRSEVERTRSGHVVASWYAVAVRGMDPRVDTFEVRARTEAGLDRSLANAYLDALVNIGMSGDEARERAANCKIEWIEKESIPLYASGRVTVGG